VERGTLNSGGTAKSHHLSSDAYKSQYNALLENDEHSPNTLETTKGGRFQATLYDTVNRQSVGARVILKRPGPLSALTSSERA
jgi:hypothetical protein